MGDALKHYGVLGMKWGVRRTPAQLGQKFASGDEKGKSSSPIKDIKKKHNNPMTGLSDEELRSKLNRIKMEDEYTRLLSQQYERSISKGKKLLNDAMGNLGKQVLDKAVTRLANKMFETKNGDDDIQQLSDAVKKLNLEKRYKELIETEKKKDP